MSIEYRSFATDETNLTKFTQLIMFVLKFTRTNGTTGGRGAFFMTLVTEQIVRYIQTCLSKVLRNFFSTATNFMTDPNELVLQNILKENKFFSMQAFYAQCGKFNPHTGLVTIEEMTEVANESPPWDWFFSLLNDYAIFRDDNTNLFSQNWFSQVYDRIANKVSDSSFPSAWNGDKLAKHAPSRLASFIRFGLRPQSYTCYLLLAVYHEIGFNIPLVSYEAVHDTVGPKLEAFCRFYIGTIFYMYFEFDDTLKKHQYREKILKALSEPKGLILHRGNHNSSKWSSEDLEKEITG